jgi:serine/threonine-protein kinase
MGGGAGPVSPSSLRGMSVAEGASLSRGSAPAGRIGGTPGRLHSSFVPGSAEPPAAGASPGLRRDATGPLGLNFADLAEGQEFLDRYRILRRVGRGGFGTVYLAEDRVIQEEIILKVLNPQLSMDEAATQRFLRELKLSRRVSHRNVIRIHDFLDLGGARAISMEYFPGKDLGRLLAEVGPLDLVRVLHIAAQVSDGLAAAHAEGVIHRDIKPANILVGRDDETRLVDFGLASAKSGVGDVSRLTKSGLLIGTPEYMAPEQISGEEVDHRVDLYSLGIVMYEALSGIRPFTADTPVKVLFQHLEGGARPLHEVIAGFPQSAAALVASAMARDAKERPAGAVEFRGAIQQLLVALETPR